MKRKKNIADGILKWVTYLFVILLLTAHVFSYFQPERLGRLNVYSLATPVLLLINVGLLLYWIVRIHGLTLLLAAVLLLNYGYIVRFYKFSGRKIIKTGDLKVMSYNVRMFNRYDWIPQDSIEDKIRTFINLKSPDIVCFQEYTRNRLFDGEYPYRIEKFDTKYTTFGHAILSKFPIIDSGSFDFDKTANNILWADIALPADTIRVYDVHLESIGINPQKENFGQKDAGQLNARISKAFEAQQYQVLRLLEHKDKSPYPVLIAGDFNNTAFSWAYRKLSRGMYDAFSEAGKGFGRTFDFPFPLRIDFILPEKGYFEVRHFKTYRVRYSDHYPVMARLKTGEK